MIPSTLRRNRVTILLALSVFSASPVLATEVVLETDFGDVIIDLFEEQAPMTVTNFLNYVEDGDYNNSLIHRSVPGFIIQGGGFFINDGSIEQIPTDAPVANEFGISNTRGTVAMAKLGGDPDSATSQWFINLADNSDNLDNQNGGFTVFGEVISGMEAVDAIAALEVWNAGGAFSSIPLNGYPGEGSVLPRHLVTLDIARVNPFAINAGINDAWFNIATPGQGFFITVFPDIGKIFVANFTFDTVLPDETLTPILGATGHRWVTAFGDYSGTTAVLDVELTEGGAFDSGEPPITQTSGYGTFTLEFTDCNQGTLTYEFPSLNLSGVIPITRVAADNVALCEALVANP